MLVKLGEIAIITMGQSPKSNSYNSEGIGMPFLQGNRTFGEKYPTFDTYTTLVTKIAQAGDVIMSVRAPVGDLNITPVEMCLGRGVCSLRMRNGNQEFLYYVMRHYVKALISKESGTVFGSVNRNDIQSLELDIPTGEEEQDSITEILVSIDKKIELNNRINDNLLQKAITLYEHLLQDTEWPTATILDVAEKVAMGPFGSNIKVSTFVPEGVPIISGNHLHGYFLEEPEFNYVTEEHAERLKNSIVFPHDLIFTHAGNIGQVAMIPDGCKYDRYVLSQRQFYLRCDETKVVPEFLLLFFHSTSGQHELLSYANQTGVPSIAQPASNLKKIPFKCPPIHEQLMWQEQVHPLLGRYLNNRLENERLSSLRDTLLPKLMSGELDISDIDF